MGKGKTVSFDLSEKIVFLYSHSEDDEDTISEFGSIDALPMLSDDDDDKQEGILSGFQPVVAHLMLNCDLWEEEDAPMFVGAPAEPPAEPTPDSLENWRVQAMHKTASSSDSDSDSQPSIGTRGTCSPTDQLKATHEHWWGSDQAAPTSSISAQSLDVVQKVHPMIIEALLKMQCIGVSKGRVLSAEPRNMHPCILSALLKLNSGTATPVW
eukprot:CAMPEP_0183533610 /NCGR_PEP_ID=MMETSP0371-20130417/26296_1 /TAXON_ID=268820 /ORGANISM="Peridinium aciculiferum, Strain PAER-2" /LENGTH=210 /DNA_ID=CAMNT_0025733861 /DNA_START=117 /DNA_END=747 /DNA_ORIENTATION=-